MMKLHAFHRQRGMTLFVALVMLVLISLLAMSTFNLGKSSIQVVNNMQNRDEGIAASPACWTKPCPARASLIRQTMPWTSLA